MQKLTLYTNPHSRGGMVRWMLEECGADYDTVAVAFGAEIKAPAYRAINPMGKVPALAPRRHRADRIPRHHHLARRTLPGQGAHPARRQ